MRLERRRFLHMLGAAAAGTAATRPVHGQSAADLFAKYEEIRSKLAGTRLFIVPYAHNDYGWLASNRWDRERTPLAHKEALEIMRRDKEFKWYVDVAFEAIEWFLDRHPEMQEELAQRVAEGRFGVAGGTFCNPDNPFMDAETTIRNMVLGRAYFEKLFPGVNLEVATFIDIHPGHSQMPQLLSKAGYRYYRITRPVQGLDRKGYRREFLWEGLDGSEVVLSYGPYFWQGHQRVGDRRVYEAINECSRDWPAAVTALFESTLRDMLANSATGYVWLPLGGDYCRPLRVYLVASVSRGSLR